MVLSAPTRDPVIVVATWIFAGEKWFRDPKNSEAVPHWDLYLGQTPIKAHDHVLAHDIDQAVSTIRAWWARAEPLPPDPFRREHLAGLRAVAARRAQIRAAAASALKGGVEVSTSLAVTVDPAVTNGLPPSARTLAMQTISRLSPENLLLNIPRETGRAKSGTLICLCRLTDSETRTSRDPWLTARVGSSESIRLGVEVLVGANNGLRWDVAPWLWTPRVMRPTNCVGEFATSRLRAWDWTIGLGRSAGLRSHSCRAIGREPRYCCSTRMRSSRPWRSSESASPTGPDKS